MNIPDYISPVVGYRVWQWDDAGIRSLNGERWHPGKPLAAGCKAASRHAELVRGTHDTPQAGCTCGVYATKSFDHLHRTGYDLRGICGAVWLWGTVVEHKFGWRAQFAYPKSFCLTSDTLPSRLPQSSPGSKYSSRTAQIFLSPARLTISPCGLAVRDTNRQDWITSSR